MNADFDYQKGRADERALIVAWLRRRTNLRILAELLETGTHTKPDKDQERLRGAEQGSVRCDDAVRVLLLRRHAQDARTGAGRRRRATARGFGR